MLRLRSSQENSRTAVLAGHLVFNDEVQRVQGIYSSALSKTVHASVGPRHTHTQRTSPKDAARGEACRQNHTLSMYQEAGSATLVLSQAVPAFGQRSTTNLNHQSNTPITGCACVVAGTLAQVEGSFLIQRPDHKGNERHNLYRLETQPELRV